MSQYLAGILSNDDQKNEFKTLQNFSQIKITQQLIIF